MPEKKRPLYDPRPEAERKSGGSKRAPRTKAKKGRKVDPNPDS